MNKCKSCTAVLEDDAKICHWCGTELDETETKEAYNESDVIQEGVEEKSLTMNKDEHKSQGHFNIRNREDLRNLLINNWKRSLSSVVGIFFICMIMLFVIIPNIVKSEKLPQLLLYYKDNNLYSAQLGAGKPELFSEPFTQEIKDYSLNRGKVKVYYEFSGELHMKSQSGDTVIDENVTNFKVNRHGDEIVYETNESKIVKIDANNKKIMIANNASLLEASKDLSIIYYNQNNYLYKKKYDEKAVKIASNICEIIKLYDSGEMYYTTNPYISITPSPDDEISKGVSENLFKAVPVRTTNMDDNSNGEFSVEENDIDRNDIINKASESIALNPDDLKSGRRFKLYYYDNKTSKLVNENYTELISTDKDEPIIYYKSFIGDNIKEEVHSTEDGSNESVKYNVVSDDKEIFICNKDKNMKLKDDQGEANFDYSDGIYYYMTAPYSDGARGDLSYCEFSDGSFTIKKYATHVSGYKLFNNHVAYITDVQGSTGDLYVDHKKIDSDVSIASTVIRSYNNEMDSIMGTESSTDLNKHSNTLMYIKYDKNSNHKISLILWKKGKTEKIDDNIVDLKVYKDGQIVYLTNKGDDSWSFDQYVYKGKGKKELIDKGITEFVR